MEEPLPEEDLDFIMKEDFNQDIDRLEMDILFTPIMDMSLKFLINDFRFSYQRII